MKQFEKELTPKKNRNEKIGRKVGKYKWYEIQDNTAYFQEFEKPKIVFGKQGVKARFTIDNDKYYVNDANFIIPIPDKKLVGILNSKLGWFLIKSKCNKVRGGYSLLWENLKQVPIVEKPNAKLEKQVEKILQHYNKLNEINNDIDRDKINEETNKIYESINLEVYKLYDLTPEEIEIIESST